MKKIKYVISIFLVLICCGYLVGCGSQIGKTENNRDNNSDGAGAGEEEMLVAVNVDNSATELPFENVWMNRSKFWGSLIFQGWTGSMLCIRRRRRRRTFIPWPMPTPTISSIWI